MQALASGRWALDWVRGPTEGSRRRYFVRPRTTDELFEDLPYHGPCTGHILGQCSMLGARGCVLSWRRRPLVCRALRPEPNGCYLALRYRDITWWWRDWYTIFSALRPPDRTTCTLEELLSAFTTMTTYGLR